MEISKRDEGGGMTMTPDEIEAAHDRMNKECDDAMARDRINNAGPILKTEERLMPTGGVISCL